MSALSCQQRVGHTRECRVGCNDEKEKAGKRFSGIVLAYHFFPGTALVVHSLVAGACI